MRPYVTEGSSSFFKAVLLDILVEAEKRGIKVALKPAMACVHVVVPVVPARQSSPVLVLCVCVVLVQCDVGSAARHAPIVVAMHTPFDLVKIELWVRRKLIIRPTFFAPNVPARTSAPVVLGALRDAPHTPKEKVWVGKQIAARSRRQLARWCRWSWGRGCRRCSR